uniref:Uncharacterized protein n=1 Tax=Dulem virus 34 TaxID=3145752 RepID=A0AAU8B4Y6_9CAUD
MATKIRGSGRADMKEYFKNVAIYFVYTLGLFAFAGLLEIGFSVISVWSGLTRAAVYAGALTLAVILTTIKTAKARHRKRQEARLLPVLLEEAITDQTAILAAIDGEPATAGKTRRRAKCKITLIALEEKREQLIKGKRMGAQK